MAGSEDRLEVQEDKLVRAGAYRAQQENEAVIGVQDDWVSFDSTRQQGVPSARTTR